MYCKQMYGILLTILAVLFISPACASSEPQAPEATASSRSAPSPRSTQPPESSSDIRTESDEEKSNQNADQDEGESDQDSDDESDSDAREESRYFHGYRCTIDCSGHEAGYKWAEDYDIDDVDDCGGNSQSFIEGCQAWVEENQ